MCGMVVSRSLSDLAHSRPVPWSVRGMKLERMREMGVLKSSEFSHSSPLPWSVRRRELGRKCGMGVSRSPSDLAHSRLYCSLVFTGMCGKGVLMNSLIPFLFLGRYGDGS